MDSFTLSLVGAAYGTSLAAGLTWRARRLRSAADALLAGAIGCAVVAVAAIALQHRAGVEVPALEVLEYAAGFVIGPLVLLHVRAAGGDAPKRRDFLLFAPAALAFALPPIEGLMAYQIAWTAAAWMRLVRRPPADRRGRIWVRVTLGTMTTVHLAQIVRSVWHASALLENIVPVVLALATLAIGAGAALRFLGGSGKGARVAIRSDGGELVARFRRAMEHDHLYRDPALSLHGLARRLETSPHELSRALNESLGQSLTTLLRGYRLDDARRRLLDPAHDPYSVEGIGQMSGFGSRSSFYGAFRDATGVTPAQFRERRSDRKP